MRCWTGKTDARRLLDFQDDLCFAPFDSGAAKAQVLRMTKRAPSGNAAASAEALLAEVKFDAAGLIPCVAQASGSGEVLMLAWMNEAALRKTLESGDVTYWSRSRQALWTKGATSGHRQRLVALRLDCDGDAILLEVEQKGPACHTNRRSCFYRRLEDGRLVVELEPEAEGA